MEHHRHVERRLAHQVERGRDRIAAAGRGDLRERPPDGVLVRRRRVRDLDALRPEGAEEVLPAGQAVRDVAGDPPPLAGAAERPQRPARAALLRPGGQDAREQGAARAVGVLVEGQVDLGRGSVQQLEQRLDEALVGERLEVGEMERRPRAARDVDHLVDRLEQAVALVAHVRDERRSRLRRLLRDGDELVRGGVGAGEVDEPEGQHPRPRLEAEPHLAAHRPQRLGGRRDAAAAEHDVAHGAVADRGDERERGPRRVERVEVLRHRRPRPLLRPRPLERAQVRLPLRAPGGVDGRRREPVGVDHLRREALRELRGEEGIVEGAKRRMRVEVDEPGAEHQPASVHDLACRGRSGPCDSPSQARSCRRGLRRRPRTAARRPGRRSRRG